MASQNYPKNYSVSDLELTCDLCNSSKIVETSEGYVCSKCGVVLEIQKMEYHRPYEVEKLQHAILDTTQIGHARERYRNKQSHKFHKLNKINKTSSRNDSTDIRAKVEVSRLLNVLNISPKFKESIYVKYKEARSEIDPGTKYRNPDKLVPGIIYFHFKYNCLPINELKLLEMAKIDKKEFDRLKLKLIELMPKYYKRNRREFILNRIMQLKEVYELDMIFYHEAKSLLLKLWEEIKCTKDDVIAGLVSSIICLCYYRDKINVHSICKTFNIQMSTIQSQVKRRIFERFNVPGFQSLVNSANILKGVIEKLGIITLKDQEEEDIEKLSRVNKINDGINNDENRKLRGKKIAFKAPGKITDIVYINIDNMMPCLNSTEINDLHLFVVKDKRTLDPILIRLLISYPKKNKKMKPKQEHIEFEISRYHFAKGPPSYLLL